MNMHFAVAKVNQDQTKKIASEKVSMLQEGQSLRDKLTRFRLEVRLKTASKLTRSGISGREIKHLIWPEDPP